MYKLAITGIVIAALAAGAVAPVAASSARMRPSSHNIPIDPPHPPLTMAQTINLFLRTAVARVHVERSFDLVTPGFRLGMSRPRWATGDIPVVPFFQIVSASWKYEWREGREHDYCVFLVSRRGEAASFLLGLVHPHRWLVSYWQPLPVFC
jgi:hypothetical protein